MNRIVKNSILFLCFLSVVLACKQEITQKQLVRPVKLEKPSKSKQMGSVITLPASINELRETKLSFRVGGSLIVLNDVVGSYVKEGEIIAKLDPRDFKLGVEATESLYKLAKTEYERFKNLLEKESVSKSTFDQIETKYKLAETDYEKALNAFKDVEIKAPFSGYINFVFVNNFETVGPSTPIISLLDMSKFEINAWISIKDASMLNNSTNFTSIIKQGEKNFRIPGKLKEIGNKTSISKQSLPITIVIDSPGEIKLRAGMTTYLEIANDKSQTTTLFQVPVSSLFRKENLTHVWVFNEKTNTVHSRQVTFGKALDNGNIEITNGLLGNESIVTAGANYLFEGQEVKKWEGFTKSNVGNKL